MNHVDHDENDDNVDDNNNNDDDYNNKDDDCIDDGAPLLRLDVVKRA